MRRLITVLVVTLVLVLAGGLVLTAIPRVQAAAARTQCQNNLKQIGLAVQNYQGTYNTFLPSATIPNEDLPCGKRLSWLVDVRPFLEQLGVVIDRKKGWQDGENIIPKWHGNDGLPDPPEPLGEYKAFRCPADPAVAAPDSPGLTNYVGLTGVGRDAAELALGYPGVGFFGCERRTKIEDIKDGMASTIMVMETKRETGPWTAGGFPTVRGLDPAGRRYLGASGQFSSGHSSSWPWLSSSATVTNVLYADGSVRGLTESVSPEVLEALVTIAGGEEVEPVGD
jgi:prepilin-type processing-associated H-X9-DG protein